MYPRGYINKDKVGKHERNQKSKRIVMYPRGYMSNAR